MKLVNKLLLIAVMIPVLSSCVDQNDFDIYPSLKDGEAVMTLNIPGSSLPTTYALGATDEDKVSEIDILAFDNDSGDFLYHTYAHKNIQQSGKTVTAVTKLSEVPGVNSYDFVILANSRKIIAACGIDPSTDTKTTVQSKLKTSVTAGKGWIADASDSDYKDIPMWGEIKGAKNILANNSYSASVNRMVSKIDISVAMSGKSKDDTFILEEVWLYNYNTAGYLMPLPANWGVPAGATVGNDHERALDASVTGLTVNKANPIDYTSYIAADGLSLTSEIYTFESAAGTAANYKNNTCIVLKGEWTEDGGSAESGWYRIDFANTDPTTLKSTYMPMKRNHYYKLKITQISGKGYATAKEAYESLPVNIDTGVSEWEDGAVGEIIYDGQYFLSISSSKFNFDRSARTTSSEDNTLYIRTNYTPDDPDAWTMGTIDYKDDAASNWVDLTVKKGSSDTGQGTEVQVTVTANKTGAKRTAYIPIHAGRMTARIEIVQLPTDAGTGGNFEKGISYVDDGLFPLVYVYPEDAVGAEGIVGNDIDPTTICPEGYRVPTISELMIMWIYQDALPNHDFLTTEDYVDDDGTDQVKEYYYWSSTKSSGSGENDFTWFASMTDGYSYHLGYANNYKDKYKFSVRCVRAQ